MEYKLAVSFSNICQQGLNISIISEPESAHEADLPAVLKHELVPVQMSLTELNGKS